MSTEKTVSWLGPYRVVLEHLEDRMSDDFAHRLRLDQIRDGQRLDLVADEAERKAVAERLGLPRIERFEAHAALSRVGEVVRARGRVAAALEQSCVVTGEPVAAHVDEPFEIAFVPAPEGSAPDEGIELGEEDLGVGVRGNLWPQDAEVWDVLHQVEVRICG